MSERLTGNWNYPTDMRFGARRIRELPDILKALGIHRPLLVTDAGLVHMDFIAEAHQACLAAGLACAIFSDIKPNPTGNNVANGVTAYRSHSHDGVIAFGGGSALDAAKAIALMAGQTRPLWDFVDEGDNWRRVDEAGVARTVAVPTTAGTGAEVGRASVITNCETHEKKIIFHPLMMPAVVISDPELTVGLPANLTAATGIDAFTHCFEALCAPGYHPMADGIALEGMRLIRDWLETACKDGANLTARGHMLAAASMGATAFQKGLGAIHAMSHPVGARYDAHHGLTNAVFLPYVMVCNRPHIAAKMERLGRVMDVEGGFDGVLQWVLRWRESLNIPHTSDALGVQAEDIPTLARAAAKDPSNGGNPAPLQATQYAALFENSLKGHLG